jgi:hypothetical protein
VMHAFLLLHFFGCSFFWAGGGGFDKWHYPFCVHSYQSLHCMPLHESRVWCQQNDNVSRCRAMVAKGGFNKKSSDGSNALFFVFAFEISIVVVVVVVVGTDSHVGISFLFRFQLCLPPLPRSSMPLVRIFLFLRLG